MSLIEKKLQEKSLNTEQSILMGQWEFDKKNIPNALKAIAIVFPHFSLHDESHSISILNNIVKMLGENAICNLSCTDLWLLLESAYCHDLGMVVTTERLEQALEGDAFVKHILGIQTDENHSCYNYLKGFDIKEGKLFFKEGEFKTDQLDAIRVLLADFFRSKHADNSKKTITSPLIEAGIESPRSIIPSRLFSILSDICKVHTQDFESVMALPMDEDGIGLDECHPRFVACMLRLGDLLDIDNNRFSETLMKTVKTLPSDTKNHFEKHKAISHLSVNTKSIEIDAICNTPKVAQTIQDWFDWISDELKTQTLKWNCIVPDGLDCYLPTLNYLRTRIDGYETVNGSKKPRLSIDTAKALELLQGKNFYNDAFDSIREIIQNAVDSTLLRIYLDAKKEKIKFESLGKVFLEYASKYPISVTIKENEGKYSVEVSDKGLGLKREQLTYLINTGSSSKNVEKKLIIEEMPDWMRPSGVFGIGFQSIFLLTDKVEILTKNCLNDEKMWIEMYSPSSSMKGDVYLRKAEGVFDTGFTIKFDLSKDVKTKVVEDPFNAYPQDLKISTIEYKIREYASKSVVPIEIKHLVHDKDAFSEQVGRQHFDYFDEETGIELRFNSESFDFSHLGGPTYYYRNAKVSSGSDGIMFLSPEVNLHFGSAKDILSLDRGSIKNWKRVEESTIKAIVNFINKDEYKSLLKRLGSLANNATYHFSFFVEYYEKKGSVQNKSLIEDVKKYKINDLTIGEIISTPVIKIRSSSKNVLLINKKDNIVTIEGNWTPLISPGFVVELIKLLFKMASDHHKHCYCTEHIKESIISGAEFLFTDDEAIPEIKLSMKDIKHRIATGSRCYLNYIPGYEEIKIPSDNSNPNIRGFYFMEVIPNMKLEKIITPFILINNKTYDCRNEELYKYVSDITGNDLMSIKNAYDRFVEEAKSTGITLGKKD